MKQSPSPNLFVHLVVHRMLHLMLVVAALSSWFAGTETAAAEDVEKPLPDKSGFSIFKATPNNLMRELTPDRPDKTESPYTVDAGHFQLEMSLVEFTRNQSEGVRTETWNVAPLNLKVGLCNSADLQLVFDNFLNVRTKDLTAGTSASQSGFGDVTMRLKMNLWGNDGGKTSFAILPFIKFPTNTDHLGNHSVEGGVIFPLAVKLPGGWDMGIETAPIFLRNVDDHGYHTEFIDSVTFGHDLFGKLGGYAEFFSIVSTERGSDWVGTVDIGLTYGLTENIQLDCGVNLGVTRTAYDVNAFTGITARF
jgi:hypothetical protein